MGRYLRPCGNSCSLSMEHSRLILPLARWLQNGDFRTAARLPRVLFSIWQFLTSKSPAFSLLPSVPLLSSFLPLSLPPSLPHQYGHIDSYFLMVYNLLLYLTFDARLSQFCLVGAPQTGSPCPCNVPTSFGEAFVTVWNNNMFSGEKCR